MSDSDVKSYKQIKDDLDDLRLLVEKSELWVYKAVKQEDKKVGNKFDLCFSLLTLQDFIVILMVFMSLCLSVLSLTCNIWFKIGFVSVPII